MKNIFFVVFALLLAGSSAWAQDAYDRRKALSSEALYLKQNKNSTGLAGQKYLALNASPKLGKFRCYRFFPGDKIRFRMHNEKFRFKATITTITDSSFSIANEATGKTDHREILLKDVKLIRVSRRIPFVSEAAYYFPIAGVLFIGADLVNKGTDNQRFTTDASAVIVGGALMAAGFVCYKLSFARLRINDRNTLKVLETY